MKLHEIDATSTGPFTCTAHSFTCTTHSFACAALLASLTRSAALICSLARSLTHSLAHGKEIYVKKLNASISFSFNPLCGGGSNGEEKLVFIQTKKAAAA